MVTSPFLKQAIFSPPFPKEGQGWFVKKIEVVLYNNVLTYV